MLKKYIQYGIAGCMLLVLASCDRYLELEPAQDVSESIALTTDGNVKNVLRGAYNVHRRASVYGGNILRNAELLAGDGEILWVGTFGGPRQIFNKQMFAENEDVTAQWLDSYNVINVTNNVLSALDVVNEGDRARIEGEARFLRALCHFDLVRFYGLPYEAGSNNSQLGVPVITTPTRGVNESSFVSRNTVQQVYDQVIADLTAAAGLLPSNNGVFATAGSANALLARVYLQMGRYAEARDIASAIIGSGRYNLTSTYAAAFNNSNPSTEDIYFTQFTNLDPTNSMTTFFSVPQFGGRDGDIDILNGHLNLYEEGDARRALFFEGAGAIRSGKWNNQFGIVNQIRLAEMYLIRAESNARLSTAVGATPTEDINRIRARAELPPLANASLEDILRERRLELAHEGFKIHDIKRLRQNVGQRPYNAPELVFPIPAREIEANSNLVQNQGY